MARLGKLAAPAVLVTALGLVVGATWPAPGQPARSAEQAGPAEPDRLLADSLRGEAAVRALGDDLDRAAARNRLSPAELTELLRRDPTLWLDPEGRLHAKDPAPVDPAAGAEPEEAAAAGPYPNAETFALHSRPGASRVIHLDFDGHAVSGTSWNSSYGVPTTAQPAFDTDGSPSTWSQAEHDAIQSVFQRVAEDFAPFDVDVTTEDPGTDALHRSSSTDTRYGTRVLVTPSSDAASRICNSSCGGVAYIGIFDVVGSAGYQPAWVFPQLLGNGTKAIAEAASHEAGHNLGLQHDGSASAGYYAGHRNWAPIMGNGYNQPVVQWSRGEYAGATNTQDDLAVMRDHGLPPRPDDHGDTPATASPLSTEPTEPTELTGAGVLGTRADVDTFGFFRTCESTTTIAAAPAPTSPNLDLALTVLDAAGQVVAESDPASGEAGPDVATGLSATATPTLPAGDYHLQVEGVGVLTPTDGYSDYGSLGDYTVTVGACSGDDVPPSVTGRTPEPGATSEPVTTDVEATFDEPVVGVDGTTVVLRNAGGAQVTATVSYDAATRTASLDPAASLAAGSAYTVSLSGGPTAIRDQAGNPLPSETWSFTTASDTVAPTVTSRTPAPGTTGVGRGTNVTAGFSEAVRGVGSGTFVLRNAATQAKVGATIGQGSSPSRWVLNPNATLAARTRFTVTLTGGSGAIRDLRDNPLTTVRWAFTTGS